LFKNERHHYTSAIITSLNDQIVKKFPFEVELLKSWFQFFQRDLPWRKTADPYAVWVSEIMLQQTQVSVVKEYYLRWMSRFPAITALAAAPLEEVIKMWEGLGYYSRARNLHEAALFVMDNYGGKLPDSREELAQIKGLGPYTIGAILSFAFHQRAAAVDGNTIRVLCRYYGIFEDIQKSSTLKKIWKIAEEILPEEEPWLVVEGLIELGATVCKRDPNCAACPLQVKCIAHNHGFQGLLPKKGKKVEMTLLSRRVFVIAFQAEFLVKKGQAGKLMADLYEFPYDDMREKEDDFPFSLPAKKLKNLSQIRQAFTRFKVMLYPILWQAIEKIEIPEYEWISWNKIKKLPFSSGHKKILKLLETEIPFINL
jgi:A/G-specific adenine glycosylase